MRGSKHTHVCTRMHGCTLVPTCLHMQRCAHTHGCRHMHTQRCSCAKMHAHMNTCRGTHAHNICTIVHRHMFVHLQGYARAQMHTNAYMCTGMVANSHTCTHTCRDTHTCARTHTRLCTWCKAKYASGKVSEKRQHLAWSLKDSPNIQSSPLKFGSQLCSSFCFVHPSCSFPSPS